MKKCRDEISCNRTGIQERMPEPLVALIPGQWRWLSHWRGALVPWARGEQSPGEREISAWGVLRDSLGQQSVVGHGRYTPAGEAEHQPAQNPSEWVYFPKTECVTMLYDPNYKTNSHMWDFPYNCIFLGVYSDCPWWLVHKEVYNQL